MPQTSEFQLFQFQLYDRVAECALDKSEREVVNWLKQSWNPEVSYKTLGKIHAKWSGVNRKLVVALHPLLTGAFGDSIIEEEQELVLHDKARLSSLQILRRLQAHLQTNPEMKEVHGLQDLMAVKWLGDEAKSIFKHNWTTKALNLHKTVSTKVQAAFLLERLSESTDMASQVALHRAHFRGHEARDETRQEEQARYDDLMCILSDAIQEELRDTNRENEVKAQAKQSRGQAEEQEPPPAALGTKGDPYGKGKAKGKGRGAIDRSLLTNAEGAGVCIWYQVGQCNRGDDCLYLHQIFESEDQKTAAQLLRELIESARARSPMPQPAKPTTAEEEAGDGPTQSRRGRSRRRSRSVKAKAVADES